MKFRLYTLLLSTLITFVQFGPLDAQQLKPIPNELSENEAKALVETALVSSPVIDGHNDLFIKYFDCKTCPRDLDAYPINTITAGETDIPRFKEGGTGGVLLNVFGREKTLESYMQGWDLLYRMEDKYKSDLTIVGTAKEMREEMQQGKIAILPSLEGATRLGDDKYLLRTFYRLGLRSVTFAYRTNLFADGSDDTAKYNGISALGNELVKEMNRLGILIDMSHISSKAMHAILDVTTAPIIFSHSNVRALCDVNRNVGDDVLKRLKKNGGIIMLCPVPYFTTNTFNSWLNHSDRNDAELMDRFKKNPADSTEIDNLHFQWQKDNPAPVVTVSDFADHFDYVKNLVGIDYIGIAGDYDGIEYTIEGMEDVSTYPKLLIELARRGWTATEIKKITSENFLRIFEVVEKESKRIKTSANNGTQ